MMHHHLEIGESHGEYLQGCHASAVGRLHQSFPGSSELRMRWIRQLSIVVVYVVVFVVVYVVVFVAVYVVVVFVYFVVVFYVVVDFAVYVVVMLLLLFML